MTIALGRRWVASRALKPVALVVLLLVLAGCAGSDADPGDPGTYQPAYTETEPTADPVPSTSTEDPVIETSDPEVVEPTDDFTVDDPYPTQAPPTLPATDVPSELVGTWDGGSQADQTFTSDGQVSIDGIGEGTVEVDGDQITYHIPGVGKWTSSWRIDPCADPAGYGYPYVTLWLDDYTYVADC